MTRAHGPYGTNEGDIWSGENSPVGQMIKVRHGGVLIHEVIEGTERIYHVAADSADPAIQDLITRARAGVEKWVAAQATQN